MPVSKFGKAIRTLITNHLIALTAHIAPPKLLMVISPEGGSATPKSGGDTVQFITTLKNLEAGSTVVGVPIGGGRYYAVGKL